MSQVRKLLQGNKIPKAQEGYKFQLDSQDVYFTDDDLAEIDKRISTLPMEYRRFLGNATTAIKSGNEYGNRAENTVTLNQLSNLGKGDMRRLEKKKGSYFESIMKPDSYAAKEAINEYLNILYSVANKRNAKEKLGKDEISLVFNQGGDGKYSLSTTAGNNYNAKSRILNILASNNAGKNYKYDVSDWDLGWLPSWITSLPGEDKAKAAQDYVNDLWTRMSSGYDPKLTPDDENFLKNFYITFGFNSPKKVGSEGTTTSEETTPKDDKIEGIIYNDKGEIDPSQRAANGAFKTYHDKDGNFYAISKEGDLKPYLFSSKDRLMRYGLNDDYMNSVLYKGRIYKPSEVTPETNLDLYNIMQSVITKNNSAKNPQDLYDSLSQIINYTDYDPTAYIYYNPEQHFWNDSAIRSILGPTGNYGIFNATPVYSGPRSLYGVYDFDTLGTNQWGFRAPFYLIVDNDGNIRLNGENSPRFNEIPEDLQYIPNIEYGAGPGFGAWESIQNGRYGAAREIPSAEPSRPPYVIYEDFDGNWYYNNSSRGMIPLDKDLVRWLQVGNRPKPAQMENGTLSGKPKSKNNRLKGKDGKGGSTSVNRSAEVAGETRGGGSRKEGGLIPIKPLPKYQMGSAMLVKKESDSVFTPSQNRDPLSSSVRISDATNAEQFWNALSSAEKKEIIATSIDLGGAIAGLVGPVGSVAGAVTGLESTRLFMQAAKERKGNLDWGDYGQAALSTLLDAVSILPWVGEAGKVAKIGSKIQKVAAPLGKIFTLMGLSAAASVVTKPINQWTTDDLVKLSSGLQAVTNISSGIRVGRGESRLASRLSKDAVQTEPVYATTKKYKRTEGDLEDVIKLDEDDVRTVVNSEKTPAETLRGILKNKYKVAEADIDKNDKALLEEFGFDTKQHRAIREKNRYVEARAVESEKPEKFSKYGYLLDPFRIVSNPEIRRRAYIDSRLSNPEVAAQLGTKRTLLSEQTGPRENIRSYRTEPVLQGAERRAYISSLARQGQMQHGTWNFRRPIDEGIGEYTEIDRSGEINARDIVHSYENSVIEPSKFHEEAVQMGREYPKVHADAVKDDLIYSVRAATKPENKPKASSSAKLGAEAISNKELVSYVLGGNEDSGLSTTEAISFLNGLTENKRNSLLNALRNSGDKRGIEIANSFAENNTQNLTKNNIKKGTDNISENVEQVRERSKTSSNKKEKDLKQTAVNLEELRNSKDPMKTLSKIANNEQAKAAANNNPKEYREALNQSLRDAVYSKLTGLRLDRYLNRVKTQMNKDGLMFKRGGVLKFKKGGGGIKGLGNWYNKVPLITELIDLAGTNIYNDNAIDHKIKSDQYAQSRWITPRFVYPTLDLSAEERQRQMLQEQRAENNPNFTSDATALMAYKNQRNAQIDNSLNAVFAAESKKTDTYNQNVNEVKNQQLGLDAQYANHNSDSIAASNSAQELHRAEGDLLRGQNFRNFMTYIKYLNNKDVERLNSASELGLSQWHDDQIQQLFNNLAPEIVTEYNSLTPEQKLNYTDLSEYIQTKHPSRWLEIKPQYDQLYKQQINDIYKFKTNTTFLPYRPQEYGNLIYKKGGRVRGTTRYRNEPEEQVWIDSNKATQAAIAKLEDNVIKLLLRALK